MKKIIILVSSTGAGHKIAGISIKELIEDIKGEEVPLIDALKLSKFPYSISDKIYYFLSNLPSLWKFFYYLSNDEKYEKFLKIQNFFLQDTLKKIVENTKPDIIFCTHPFFVPVLNELKSIKKFQIISVITDFGEIHKAWLINNYDLLWIPSEFTKKEIEKKTGLKGNYEVLGYPVRRGFRNITELKKDYILIMGGGRGAGPILEIFKILKNFKIKEIYICGTNEKLKNKLLKVKEEKKLDHIEIIGYTDRIYELMKDAFIIISKPGGSTVAESNYLLKPLIAINPLPGQEQGNANFIKETDSGLVLDKLNYLSNYIEEIIKEKKKFEFKEKIRDYSEKQIKFIKDFIL
ncbi:MAG: glycosyltransferase [candidate division WOR-3 bacterium]